MISESNDPPAIEAVRWMVTTPGYGRLKGLGEAEAREIARQRNGTVSRQTVVLLWGGREILDPWVEVD